MNPFLEPQTPPRSSKGKAHVQFTGNETSLEFVLPQTPNKKMKDHLQTPVTLSNTKRVRNFLQTPSSVKKINGSFLASPEMTPHKSPRKTHRRRKSQVTEAETSLLQTPARDASFGLFLPTPSTVGSGRKPGASRPHLKPPPVSLEALAASNDDLHFEDENEEVSASQFSEAFVSPKKENSFIYSCNLKAQPQVIYAPESPSKTRRAPQAVPMTPRKQLIDDELVNEWHNHSRPAEVVVDESDINTLKAQSKGIPNPFLSSSEAARVPSDTKNGIDYNTHAEYVNARTGERKIVELLERQKSIRPKKLDFSTV